MPAANHEGGTSNSAYLVELGWRTDHALASLAAIAHDQVEPLRRNLAVAKADPARLAQMGYVRLVSRFLGLAPVGRLPFSPAFIAMPYAVRVHDERLLGPRSRKDLLASVWNAVVTPSVDLRRPRTELHAYVTARGVAWGCAIPEPQFQPIDQQRRPFIRSYVVPSRKARWLNDLGRVRASARVLDPFCGTGSILIEAARLGASVFGSDISAETVGGALLNFAAGRLETDLRVADALDPSGWDLRFDAVVTDLPYGRTASLHGVAVDRLATRWPGHLPSILNDEARVVVMAPEGAVPTRTPGLKSRARLTERVHKALSREIVVFERS